MGRSAINRLINTALNEEGYLEKQSRDMLDDKTANAGTANITKYARDIGQIKGFYNGGKQGVAWCDVFVDWCFIKTFGAEIGRKMLCQPLKSSGAGCRYSRDYYIRAGRLFDYPEAGDQVFFYPKDGIGGAAIQHTAIVYETDNKYIYTIEGNTSGAAGVVDNGGGVFKKRYPRDFERLAGFGRPRWDLANDEEEENSKIPESTPTEQGQTPIIGKAVIVKSRGGKVNIRNGNGMRYEKLGEEAPGTAFKYVVSAENGWHAFEYKGCVAWISGEFSLIRE